MKPLVTGIVLALVFNLLALAGGAAWLGFTGRLDRARIDGVADMFKLTIEQEEIEDKKAAEALARAEEEKIALERLEAVSFGPKTLADRLDDQQMGSELAKMQLDRLKAEIRALQDRLSSDTRIIEQRKAELDAEKEKFDKRIEDQKQNVQEEGFRQAIAKLQELKPRQAKDVFTQLISQGDKAQVVEYLAAMQSRKAGKILREFKDKDEIPVVTDLLQQLRNRGVDDPSGGSLGQT